MDEQGYLAEVLVGEFTEFLRELILRGRPGVALKVGTGSDRRVISTLREAVEAYRWRGESFAAVNIKLEALRGEMQAALDQCAAAEGRAQRRLAELELLFVSTKVLSWGRVYEGAFPFLIHQAETGVLSENLRRAAVLLNGAVEEVGAFDDNPYRSDCGMTKIYATINERSVVYDDRLGAALGLLCRRFLEGRGHRGVPGLLQFMAGDLGDAARDPSGAGYAFTAKRAGREHARWNLRANWIVSALAGDAEVADALGGHLRDRIRRLEAALFMLGDDVRDQPRLGNPPARAERLCADAVAVDAKGGASS